MLQSNEIQERFANIEQAINQASQACSAESSVPSELRDCIQQLDQQSLTAKQVLQSQDTARIRDLVEGLEQLGDRAKQACGSANVTPQVKTAVLRVHDGLSELKHQLH
ncbi:MAG: hypothetical protein V4754_21050 [Pseudomonadota bacterium]